VLKTRAGYCISECWKKNSPLKNIYLCKSKKNLISIQYLKMMDGNLFEDRGYDILQASTRKYI